MEHMSEKWIRASEISDYLYCRRSWWLKRSKRLQTVQTREILQGNQHHGKHGRLLMQSIWAKRAAYVLLFVIVAYVTFQILLSA
jgi:hypothetical protein